MGKHIAGGFLRIGKMADVLEKFAADMDEAEDAEPVIKIIRKFDEASFTSDMFEMKGKLTFKDKKINGLKQIVDLSVELAEMRGESAFEGEFEGEEEGEPEEEATAESIEIEPELEELAPRKR